MANDQQKHPGIAWMPEFRPMNVVKRHSGPMHPGDAWHLSHWYEAPREDPILLLVAPFGIGRAGEKERTGAQVPDILSAEPHGAPSCW